MYVVIENPVSGEILWQRELKDHEILDERPFAEWFAREWFDGEIDESDGYIPNCFGDFRVEFCEDPDNRTCIWSGESYYVKAQ